MVLFWQLRAGLSRRGVCVSPRAVVLFVLVLIAKRFTVFLQQKRMVDHLTRNASEILFRQSPLVVVPIVLIKSMYRVLQ